MVKHRQLIIMKAHKEYRKISIFLEKFLNLNLRNLKINPEQNVQIHDGCHVLFLKAIIKGFNFYFCFFKRSGPGNTPTTR